MTAKHLTWGRSLERSADNYSELNHAESFGEKRTPSTDVAWGSQLVAFKSGSFGRAAGVSGDRVAARSDPMCAN
jgi:hypothetical protein